MNCNSEIEKKNKRIFTFTCVSKVTLCVFHKCLVKVKRIPTLLSSQTICRVFFSKWPWTLHKAKVIMWKKKSTQYSHKAQWQKIVVSTIFNHKLSKYIKLSEITTIQVFNSVENEWHLTLSISWRIDYEIGLTCTWIIAPNFTIYVLLWKFFCMNKPLPNGIPKFNIVQMHR
jgi:hypothetical protein